MYSTLTRRVPEKLQLYGLYVYYVVHICNFGMLRVKKYKVGLKVGSRSLGLSPNAHHTALF